MHITNIQSIHHSQPEYWENCYNTGEMAWDLGEPTPIFKNWIHAQKKPLSICILGAGNGWDALYLSEKGHEVTAVDFADSAIINMTDSAKKKNLNLNIQIFLSLVFYEQYCTRLLREMIQNQLHIFQHPL